MSYKAITHNADRHGLSKRGLFTTVAAVLTVSPDCDIDDFVLSPSSAARNRKIAQKTTAATFKDNFIPPEFCVAHWDKKLLCPVFVPRCSDTKHAQLSSKLLLGLLLCFQVCGSCSLKIIHTLA